MLTFIFYPKSKSLYNADEDLQQTAGDLFDVIASGKVKIPIHQRYDLDDVQQAHTDLESRKTTGTTLLMP